jgi:5-methylcytosine-specific restriction endonuclease McrA
MRIRDKTTGRFKSENLTRACLVCGKEFRVKRCNYAKSKYCSKKCFHESRKGYKPSPETIRKIVKANTGRKRSEAFRLETSLRQLGSGNSMYKNGWTKDKTGRRNYGEKKRFGKTKDEWIEYFGGKCGLCGISNYDHLRRYGIRLSIHHKDKKGRNVPTPNNDTHNLQLLCGSCHGKVHMDSKRARDMQKLSISKWL